MSFVLLYASFASILAVTEYDVCKSVRIYLCDSTGVDRCSYAIYRIRTSSHVKNLTTQIHGCEYTQPNQLKSYRAQRKCHHPADVSHVLCSSGAVPVVSFTLSSSHKTDPLYHLCLELADSRSVVLLARSYMNASCLRGHIRLIDGVEGESWGYVRVLLHRYLDCPAWSCCQ